MLPPWLIIVLFFLAVYRLSRFIVQDTFPPIAWIRWRLTRDKHRDATEPTHWLIYLIGDNVNTGCPWCASLWLGGLGSIGVIYATHWHWWIGLLLWWGSSAVTGLLAQLEAD